MYRSVLYGLVIGWNFSFCLILMLCLSASSAPPYHWQNFYLLLLQQWPLLAVLFSAHVVFNALVFRSVRAEFFQKRP